MNTLYGLLTYRTGAGSGWYSKLHTPVAHSSLSRALCDEFTARVPDDRLPMFACVVCRLAMESMFRDEILKLDKENTYGTIIRNPDTPSGDQSEVMQDLTTDAESTRHLYKYLDADIRDRLVVPTWAELASAVCLQLLRSML